MIGKDYFYIQQLSFKLCGIDIKTTKPELMIKRPLLLYVPLLAAILHVAAMIHYAYVNGHDFVEVTESLAVSCQILLAIWKTLIFNGKCKDFVNMISAINSNNFKAGRQELPLIDAANNKDVKLCKLYCGTVLSSAFVAFMSPIIEAIYFYYKTGKLILRVPFKASYFWPHTELSGYSLVYLWNILSIYNTCSISLAIDTLFFWLVCNISAQFHILFFRFNEAAKICCNAIVNDIGELNKQQKAIKSCIGFHNQTLQLAAKLNHIYKEIIFVKFLISCTQICFLVFRLSSHSESLAAAAHMVLFLTAVSIQLMMYCYNGQRIRDESLQVAPEIYLAFDWSQLTKSCKKLLLLPMMRSQNSSHIGGIFFTLDLSLFLWVFKTAGSLITALKTIDENQE